METTLSTGQPRSPRVASIPRPSNDTAPHHEEEFGLWRLSGPHLGALKRCVWSRSLLVERNRLNDAYVNMSTLFRAYLQ